MRRWKNNKIINDWKCAEYKYAFRIIIGKGVHSKGNISVLKPMSIEILENDNFKFKEEVGALYFNRQEIENNQKKLKITKKRKLDNSGIYFRLISFN